MIEQLSKRDRIALAVGGGFVLIILIFFGIVGPYLDGLAALDNKIVAKQRQLDEVRALRQEYLVLEQQIGEAEKKMAGDVDFSLFSFVEGVTGRIAGKENLVYMRPQPSSVREGLREESVEVKLERIDLDQTIRLLYEIETAEAFLPVKNLRLRTRFDDRSSFDAVLTISAFERNQ